MCSLTTQTYRNTRKSFSTNEMCTCSLTTQTYRNTRNSFSTNEMLRKHNLYQHFRIVGLASCRTVKI
jgi:hypothetical protein